MALQSQIEQAVRVEKPPRGLQVFDHAVDHVPQVDENERADAALFVRRLGNSHDCTGTGCAHEWHVDDVAATNRALILLGLAPDPYPSVERPPEISCAVPIEGKRAKARRLREEAEARQPRPDWSWQEDAACQSADPELFFQPDGERPMERKIREGRAAAICNECPVRSLCLDAAIEIRAVGVWGGLNDDERASERRRRMRRATAA